MFESATQGFRLSPQQKHLWALQHATAGPPFRLVAEVLVYGNIQQGILERSFRHIVRRHEILRTTFHCPPGIKMPFQVVTEGESDFWQTLDLRSLSEEEAKIRKESYFAAECQREFDFEKGPLLRVSKIIFASDRQILLLSIPALCADLLTLSNFSAELAEAYEFCLAQGDFASEPMQYADFAEWQNELLEADDEHTKAGRAYWQKREGAAAAALELPLERTDEAAEAFGLDSVSVAIDASLNKDIQSIALDHETSIAVILLASWKALIARLARASAPEFVIFTLFDSRKVEDLQSACGPYAKYLPIRCLTKDEMFAEQVRRIKEALKEADEWEEHFDPAVFSLTARDSVAFEFERPSTPVERAGISFALGKKFVCLQPFKLKLVCLGSDDLLRIELQYNKSVFDKETVKRLAGYFEKLLKGMCRVGLAAAGEIDLLDETERRQLLVELNQTTTDFPKDQCFPELFEEQVEKTPSALAVIYENNQLSYSELNARANQLAHLLRSRGVGPNTCVGLCLQRSAETIIGLLGILKAGGAYVPLNPEHPVARLSLQLSESKALLCLTDDRGFADSLDFEGEIIDLLQDQNLLQSEATNNPEWKSDPNDLVYVIYTSGSTGVPKGVAVRHRNLLNYSRFILERLRIERPLHFATVSTITADLGNTCIFPSLISGGCLHLISYEVSMEGGLFSNYLARHPIDVLKIVPSHLQALLASGEEHRLFPEEYLILGGEALSRELLQCIHTANAPCKILNHYGPTETTVGSLTFNVEAQRISPYSHTVPVGRPIANTCCYILDETSRLLPLGVAGELYIGGAGVAAGYLNQPGETATRFVPDPFSTDSAARLYRTGDLARYLPDGNIEFLGRIDNQVKIRGFRVELGEIEAALLEHPRVRQAVAVIRHESGDDKLIAYLVVSGSNPPGQDQMRQFLKQKLPDYMIPGAFVYLAALPLTPNGKLDRAALPAPDESRALERSFVGPRTKVEKELASLWTNLLKLNEVGVNDNFFDLGGHSLLATQLISRVRKTFEVDLPLRSIFESPTVAELAARVETATNSATAGLLQDLEALEQLSDEEAERLLELEKNPRAI